MRTTIDPIARKGARIRARLGSVRATSKGSTLARQLQRYFRDPVTGSVPILTLTQIEGLCSLLGRLTPAYDRIQEAWCNEEMSDSRRVRLERREAQIEAHARAIVAALPPLANGQRATVKFEGDPRGYTIKVVIPGAPHDGNTYGLGGEFGI